MSNSLLHACLAVAALGAALLYAPPSSAQSPSFGALSQSSDEPIDIESDVLVVYDAKKYATFKGNVKAVQGTTTLRARELDVHYVGGREKLTGPAGGGGEATAVPTAAGGQKADGTRITKIEAKGNVIITSEDDQTTTSDWALYDVPTQLVTVGGNVVLMQGQNVLKGDRLVIDLKTGESRFENTGNTAEGGRIRALFMPKDAPSGDAAADGEKTDDGKPRSIVPAPDASTEMPASGEAPASAATGEQPQPETPASGEAPTSVAPGDEPQPTPPPAAQREEPWAAVPGQ